MTQRNFAEAAILLHESDNVAVLKRPMKPGDELVLEGSTLRIPQAIAAGHKVATRDIPAGAPVRKYGQIIGFAFNEIKAGDHVHTQNVVLKEFGRDYQFSTDVRAINLHSPSEMRFFQGYARPNGRAGTRNYVAVISSVSCSASVSHYVRDRFRTPDFHRDFPQMDGVIAYTHKAGCAMDPGEPQQVLQRVLAGIARHPNISGYVMIGLGCESNQVDAIRQGYQ